MSAVQKGVEKIACQNIKNTLLTFSELQQPAQVPFNDNWH